MFEFLKAEELNGLKTRAYALTHERTRRTHAHLMAETHTDTQSLTNSLPTHTQKTPSFAAKAGVLS
jgi:hypothetical protein